MSVNRLAIHINSANRIQGTSSDFTIDISKQLNSVGTITSGKFDSISLLSFNCPKSWYLINDTNNNFTLNENSVLTKIVLINGNYTISSLVTELKAAFLRYPLSYTYAVTFDSRTGKLTFTASNISGAQPIFIFPTNYAIAGLHRIIGFDYGSSNQFSAGQLTSTNIVNLQLASAVKLMTDLTNEENNILSTIISDNPDFSSITWHNNIPTWNRRILTSSLSMSPRFYLLNADTNLPLDLNGLNFNFVILFYRDLESQSQRIIIKNELINRAVNDQ